MKHGFDVDGFHYVVEYKNSEFFFYIDTRESRRDAYEMTEFERGFWDDPPERVYMTSVHTSTIKPDVHNVFKIKREVLKFIDSALRRYRPHYFCYRTLEPVKLVVFDRVAIRLAKRYGYYDTWEAKKARFMFFKVTED